MNCSRYQFELSKCLDGRLPGTGRTEVMAHVERCPRCAEVWEEMQAAQSIVLGLQSHRVDAGFRDEVWRRIRSGEGAPEVLLQEPIRFGTKIRYGLMGAAAAAAFLAGLHLWTRPAAPSTSDDPAGGEARVADAPIAPQDDRLRRLSPSGPGPNLPEPPLSQLASQTADRVTGAARRLRAKREWVLEQSQTQPKVVWTAIERDVRTLHDGLFLLETLRKNALVELHGASADCMVEARSTLEQLERKAHNPQSLRGVFAALDGCPLDGLANGIRVTYSIRQSPYEQVFTLYAGDPHVRRVIRDLELMDGSIRLLLPAGIPWGEPERERPAGSGDVGR